MEQLNVLFRRCISVLLVAIKIIEIYQVFKLSSIDLNMGVWII